MPAPERLLRDTAATLDLTLYGEDGEAADAAAEPTVTVVRANGATLTSGTSTKTPTTTGQYTFVLTPAQLAQLDILTVTWAFTLSGNAEQRESQAEIVGAHLFSEAQARAFSSDISGGAPLASSSDFPDAEIVEVRDLITDRFAEICRVAFIPRYRLHVADGPGGNDLLLPDLRTRDTLIAAATRTSGATAWTALTSAELAAVFVDPSGVAYREAATWPVGRRNVRVEYEHGWEQPPLAIQDAALQLAIHILTGQRTGANPRAMSITTQEGQFQRLATPGLMGSFVGLPNVDEVLKEYSQRIPAVA